MYGTARERLRGRLMNPAAQPLARGTVSMFYARRRIDI
jgi:hypothetical protein